ncbi:DUF1254 domain-containing protein [Sphingorhabdus sp.]|jgi:hypothetical protein|uniref:DUF1254 domain-containing protein n=2 Tax=Sphingorhabdus sp. TaxID=1902408 RepID=UPI002FDDA274
MSRLKTSALVVLAISSASLPIQSAHSQNATIQSPEIPPTAQSMSEDWRENYAYAVGLQAVIYGYPAVKNLNMRFGMVEKPVGATDTPLSQWFHLRRPADATDTTHGSVSNDFLYSVGWFDVRKEPLVISVPDSGKRYLGVQFMEWYSDIFAYLGTRATGGAAGSYLLVSADWQGETPPGIAGVIRAPTPTGAIIQRVGFLGDRTNLKPVHTMQDASDMRPLSKWLTRDASPSTDRQVLDPADRADPMAFFVNLNRAMTENPPPAKDRPILSLMRSVGLGPGQSDDLSKLDAGTRKGLERALRDGLKLIAQVSVSGGETKFVNRWAYNQTSWGRTGESDDFLTRAATQSFSGFLEHQIEEVVKLRAHFDANGELLDGSTGRYVLHFNRDQIPEAKAFWSVTVYNTNYDLHPNPLNRFSFGSHDKGLKFDKNGGVTFYLQADAPTRQFQSNWLPIPKAPFNLFLRAYLPGEALIRQSYVPPAVSKVD